jgi:hypothetical protein
MLPLIRRQEILKSARVTAELKMTAFEDLELESKKIPVDTWTLNAGPSCAGKIDQEVSCDAHARREPHIGPGKLKFVS